MNAKAILGIVPGLQALRLVGYNMKNVKDFGMKKNPKTLIKTGVGTLVGIGLIKTTASAINSL